MKSFTKNSIRKLLIDGEGVQLDFKKTITSKNKIAKTISSFANTHGGVLLVGVLDDASINGIKTNEEDRYMLLEAATHFCNPLIPLSFKEIELDGKIILVVEIEESKEKPHYALGEDGKWWVHIRVKDKSLLASKIVVDVLKKETTKENVLIEYSTKEQALLQYLQTNERITLREFCKLINISHRRASRILVNLVLSGIIRVHQTEKHDFYSAV